MSSLRRPSRILRVAITVAFALMTSFTAVLTTPRPVVACSCVRFDSLKDVVTPDNVVFTGIAGVRQGRGVPVQVAQWLWGRGAAPTVWLADSSFGDGAACGTEPPPPGSSWLWVGYPVENGDFGTGLCSPAGRLDSPEGKAMLEEAQALFGGEAPVPPDPTAAPTSDAALPTPVANPADLARDQAAVTIIGALLVGTLALFGVVVLVARRASGRRPG